MPQVREVTRFICLFHEASRAQGATRALQELGFSNEDVHTVEGLRGSTDQDLLTLGVPDRDLSHLRDGLQHGGVLVSLEAPEDRSSEIERIFHHYSAGKIDETELNTAPVDTAPVAAAVPVVAEAAERFEAPADLAGATVVPVVAEELVVGKREVQRGAVRVYRHTVEEPVQRDIDLHSERVVLEYREVNRPVTENDLRAGSQEIELVETAEVPVVEKRARVVEEVHVGKVEADRTETVHETLRHTEVDVEPVQDASEDLPPRGVLRG